VASQRINTISAVISAYILASWLYHVRKGAVAAKSAASSAGCGPARRRVNA